jgi:hypothetical protein
MENLINEIENCIENFEDSTECTPESIAWDLLVGDIDSEKKGKLIGFCDRDKANNNSDLLTYRYEMLITIFMEMIFNIAKLNFYSENITSSENIKFLPDYEKINPEVIFPLIQEKFKILGISVFIDSENMEVENDEDKENIIKLVNDRYCRVILRYYDNDEYFNNNNIEDDIYYHMKLNGLNKSEYKKIREIYSVIFLNSKIYKIYFDEI